MNTVVSFALGGTMDPATAALVCDGLFDRFPQLKVAIVESRAGYASYLMDRLDKKFARFGNLVPLKRKPSEYMRRRACHWRRYSSRSTSTTASIRHNKHRASRMHEPSCL